MFSEEVTNKDGVVKNIVAGSQEELDEAVKIAKADESPKQLDINDPKDGNKIVSPDNTWQSSADEQSRQKVVDPDVSPVPKPVEEEKVEVKVKKK